MADVYLRGYLWRCVHACLRPGGERGAGKAVGDDVKGEGKNMSWEGRCWDSL